MHRKHAVQLVLVLGLALAPALFAVARTLPLHAQEEAPSGDVTPGLYQSETLPAADTPGRRYTLGLISDGTASMLTDFMSDNAPIEEMGTWLQEETGNVVVTLTGTVASAYATPVVITFAADGEILATVPEDPNYGTEGLTLTLAQTESEYLDSIADVAPVLAAGTYISKPFAAGNADGLAVLHLAEDGTALGISITLAAAAPVTEAGTWRDNGDGSLTVTLTATLTAGADGATISTVLAEPNVMTFQSGAGDELINDNLALYPAASLGEETVVEEPQALLYLSEVLPSPDTPGRLVSLALGEQGDATLTTDYMDGEAPVVEVGIWEEIVTGEILVMLEGTDTETYAEPVEIVFAAEDGTLTATEYDPARYGDEGLTLTVVPHAEGARMLEVGAIATMTYGGELPAVEDVQGEQVTMTFGEDGSFQMSTAPLNGEPALVEFGAWTQGDDGTIMVTITGTEIEEYDQAPQFTIETQEDGSILAVNQELFGAEGVLLTLQSTQ